jgi:hypothetical protein
MELFPIVLALQLHAEQIKSSSCHVRICTGYAINVLSSAVHRFSAKHRKNVWIGPEEQSFEQ